MKTLKLKWAQLNGDDNRGWIFSAPTYDVIIELTDVGCTKYEVYTSMDRFETKMFDADTFKEAEAFVINHLCDQYHQWRVFMSRCIVETPLEGNLHV